MLSMMHQPYCPLFLYFITACILASLSYSAPQNVQNILDNKILNQPIISVVINEPTLDLSAYDLKNRWKPPLSTRGRYIVDADGKRFKLKAGNWHGASGTYLGRGDKYSTKNHHAGEAAFQTPLCLDRTPIGEIVESFLELGINTIRLPFSNEMLHSKEVPPDEALRANPQLKGMTPLQIYDACIAEITKQGLAVILNNHVVKSIWCCGFDNNAMWNSAQSDDQWIQDWIFLVKRYKNNSRVVGADLYNEVRRSYFSDPVWGEGGKADWWLASQVAGSRLLREANPDILIIIEGINWVGIPTQYTRHYRPELQPVRQLSHTLPVLDKLVYCAHFYAYTGPNATGGADIGRSHDTLYRDLSPAKLESTVNDFAFFVATTAGQHYTNPVWISEMGSAGRGDYLIKDWSWWSQFTSLLIKYDIDYALWPLTGWQEDAKGDLWALNAWSRLGERLSILDLNDWRLPAFKNLILSNGKADFVYQSSQWRMLYTGLGSMQMSNRLHQERNLRQRGQIKASCPDGLRLAGLSSHQDHLTGLCTDAGLGRNVWNSDRALFEITSLHTQQYSKYQCPLQHHIVGFSSNKAVVEDIVCAETSQSLISNGVKENIRTVWLGKQDQVASSQQEAWHSAEAISASCSEDEVLVGIAKSPSGETDALFCQILTSASPQRRIKKLATTVHSLWNVFARIFMKIL